MRRGLELSSEKGAEYADFYGPILDLHTHPRALDAILPINQNQLELDGKAGLVKYTEAAQRSGISKIVAMTNEARRIYAPETEEGTIVIASPVTTPEELLSYVTLIQQLSRIPVGVNMSVAPETIGLVGDKENWSFTTKKIEEYYSSWEVKNLSVGLKIFCAESQGGLIIPLEYAVEVAKVYHSSNPSKRITVHFEGADVEKLLSIWPDGIPITIAHVSSQQEMEAGIIAKQDGKNVRIEVTPQHMFLTEATKAVLGPVGCVKPELKKPEDQKYLWDNMEHIDQIGSDCAPHRHQDKFGPDGKPLEKPSPGMANHTVLVPLFLEAIHEGRLTEGKLYDLLVKNPHDHLGIPIEDSVTRFRMTPITAEEAEIETQVEYGVNPFLKSPETPPMRGHLEYIKIAGRIMVIDAEIYSEPSYDKLIRS